MFTPKYIYAGRRRFSVQSYPKIRHPSILNLRFARVPPIGKTWSSSHAATVLCPAPWEPGAGENSVEALCERGTPQL
jgi:hypothetical protein